MVPHGFIRIKRNGNIVRNDTRLVAKGYKQLKVLILMKRLLMWLLESIRLLLVVVCLVGFKVFQIDVNSAFLNGILYEEAYVEQPKGFENPYHFDYAFKLKKALYRLKQALRAW